MTDPKPVCTDKTKAVIAALRAILLSPKRFSSVKSSISSVSTIRSS